MAYSCMVDNNFRVANNTYSKAVHLAKAAIYSFGEVSRLRFNQSGTLAGKIFLGRYG